MKNSNDTGWDRTSDPPICSTAPNHCATAVPDYKYVVLALFSHCPYSHALIIGIYFRNLSPKYFNLYFDSNAVISHTPVIHPQCFPIKVYCFRRCVEKNTN